MIRDFLKRLSPSNVLYPCVMLWRTCIFILKRKPVINRYFQSHSIHKLQIGCGNNILDGWLNTDVSPLKNDVIYLNAGEHFPFSDCSMDYILAEHLIEHFNYQQGHIFLTECYRVLKPGGKIRLSTPDLATIARIYTGQRNGLEEKYVTFIAQFISTNAGFADETFALNQTFYGWGHRFIYDYKTLSHNLGSAGFGDIRRYKSGESNDPNLRDVEMHGIVVPAEFNYLETMALEATK